MVKQPIDQPTHGARATPQSAGQVLQHAPFVVVGAVSPTVHIVGKHQTFLQVGIALALPPCDPVAPTASLSSTMFGGSITCGSLSCPAGFSEESVPGHCCPYCVNPNIVLEREAVGATGSHGGKASAMP